MIHSGKIKIKNDGNIIMQFSNYHHVIDSDTELYYKKQVDEVIAEKDAKITALDAEVFKQKHHAKLFFDERNYAEAELKRTKRALWLARAKICKLEVLSTLHREWEWTDAALDAFEKAERKCRTYADKFKEE